MPRPPWARSRYRPPKRDVRLAQLGSVLAELVAQKREILARLSKTTDKHERASLQQQIDAIERMEVGR